MDVEALPTAERLWWAFAVQAALAAARGDDAWAFDPAHQLLRHDHAAARLRMQRLHGGRAVLWGRTSDRPATTSWTGIPGWATSDAVRDWLAGTGATFVAWHARDGWDTATPDVDLAPALAPVLDATTADLVEAARCGAAGPAMLADLTGAAGHAAALAVLEAAGHEAPPVQGMVRSLLAGEIRAQMRRTPERDRMLPQRPVQVVRWARVAQPPRGFQHVVHQRGPGDLVPALGNPALPDQFARALDNVLARLHLEEADDASGAWLFARVGFDGVNVHLDRAFDSRPAWCEDDGPSLDVLATEMARRAPRWRPAWSRLLP
jgi:hypothetical protein